MVSQMLLYSKWDHSLLTLYIGLGDIGMHSMLWYDLSLMLKSNMRIHNVCSMCAIAMLGARAV